MHLEARTAMRQEQRLLPQMLQSIEVLQLATQQLEQLIQTQLETNEVLESDLPPESTAVDHAVAAAQAVAETDWEHQGVRAQNDDVDGRRALLENQPEPRDELLATVREQVAFRELPQALGAAVVLLAERLDERGWLPVTLEDVAAETGVARELLALARSELQAMEPRGLGAGSAVEAMLLQVVDDPDFALLEQLLTRHLDELARNKLPEVARALQIDVQTLVLLRQRLRELTPAPARELRASVEPAIAPDVVAWIGDGEVCVAPAEAALSHLWVNADYEALANDRGTDKQLRSYLRQKLRAANELIAAIAHRQTTLLAVARAIMQTQRACLERGRSALRPLRMTDLAAQLSLHPSTISRAIAGKYVATTFGTLPLRAFCEGGADANGEAGTARSAVACALAEIVRGEDKSKPLADEELGTLLAQRGIDVARRTVAKLREEAGIPSSYRRRAHKGRKEQ